MSILYPNPNPKSKYHYHQDHGQQKDMHGTSMNLHPLFRPLLFYPRPPHLLPKFSIPTSVHHHGFSPLLLLLLLRSQRSSKRCSTIVVRATRRESPFEVLGIPPSATSQEIKRAYRKLALKYHPDVNKEANAQERFMRIKHAYNTLINSEKYDSNNRGSDYSSTSQRSRNQTQQEEEFYGLGNFFKDVQITIADLFRDLQAEYQNWDASISSQEKPKSLWEELADIGEEFVEFLEKELNINDTKSEAEDDDTDGPFKGNPNAKSRVQDDGNIKSNIEENIDDIEAALAQLKKDLGL